MYYEYSDGKIGVAYGKDDTDVAPAWSNLEIAEIFERCLKAGIADGTITPRLAEAWATKAAHYYHLHAADVEKAAQAERNRQHRIEVARAFATLPKILKQEAADRALTDYLGGRQARLDEGMEES